MSASHFLYDDVALAMKLKTACVGSTAPPGSGFRLSLRRADDVGASRSRTKLVRLLQLQMQLSYSYTLTCCSCSLVLLLGERVRVRVGSAIPIAAAARSQAFACAEDRKQEPTRWSMHSHGPEQMQKPTEPHSLTPENDYGIGVGCTGFEECIRSFYFFILTTSSCATSCASSNE